MLRSGQDSTRTYGKGQPVVFSFNRQFRPAGARIALVGLAMVLLGAALAACLPIASAQSNQPLRLGDLQIPAPRGYVNDFAGSLSRDEVNHLEQLCRQIDRTTGAQIALVIVTGLEGESSTDVRTRLYEAWGVGRARDDRGLLILHALLERRIEVEVGYGLEGVLPDGRVGRVLDESVTPHFKEGDFFAGYWGGLEAFAAVLGQDPDSQSGQDAYRSSSRRGAGGREGRKGFPLGSLLMVPIFIYLAIRHPRLLLLLLIFGGRGGGRGTGGGFGGGFGGFGGGMSGGGGAGRSY